MFFLIIMDLLTTKSIARKAIISERPYSARFIAPQRITKTSLNRLSNLSLSYNQGQYPVGLQDMGTSTMKIEYHDSNTLPVQNITFKITPNSKKTRKRRVIVVKHLKEDNNLDQTSIKSQKNSNRSMLRFFDIAKNDDDLRNTSNKNGNSNSRPATGKISGPVTKRALSEVYFDNLMGARLFDISEVLSIANGTINFKNLKVRR